MRALVLACDAGILVIGNTKISTPYTATLLLKSILTGPQRSSQACLSMRQPGFALHIGVQLDGSSKVSQIRLFWHLRMVQQQ